MLIIIEGPDKAGKTTLANAIVKKFNCRYAHFGAPGPDPAREYADFLLNLKEPTVCDRFYIGEQVYGPLLRGKSLITNLQKAVIERLCRFRGAILIWACTPLEVCQERLAKSSNEDVTAAENAVAWKMFRDIIKEVHIAPACYYDSSVTGSLDRLLLELDPIINTMRQMAGLASYYCNGFGSIFGDKLVIVGEALNEKITWIGKPFDKGVSSEFLYSCLREANVPESMLYFCNANKLSVEEAMFLRQGSSTPWLALGDKASRRLTELRVTHACMPHPQYWKRFHSGERTTYVEMIKKWTAQCLTLPLPR